MACDEGLAEKRMFGGLAVLLHDNMVCGKENEAEALARDRLGPMQVAGRKMGGMVEVTDEALADDGTRAELMRMALAHAAALPPR